MEKGLKRKWIKDIALGPRQLLFGLDLDDTRLTERVLTRITGLCREHGRAAIHDIVADASSRDDLPETEILQTIFGLVHELKICFYHHGCRIPADEAKQRLIKNPDTDLGLVLNEAVPASTFQAVYRVFQKIEAEPAAYHDQHDLAFAILQAMIRWHTDLKTWYAMAAAGAYPGKDLIRTLMDLVGQLLENRTAHAVLTFCFNQKEVLTAAARQMDKLRRFYTGDIAFWDELSAAMPQFEQNLPRISQDPETAEAYHQLADIAGASDPFDRIFTARDLFDTVNRFHQQIEIEKLEDCRQLAKNRIDAAIDKLSKGLTSIQADPDTRNHILLPLRMSQKKIDSLPGIGQVNQTCRDVIDLAMDQFEALTES
ncbi:MAG: hypothetical protein K9J51_02210 [Desulfotignum sp.]|nr:hypothetical protein [Desulfotignum sp.]